MAGVSIQQHSHSQQRRRQSQPDNTHRAPDGARRYPLPAVCPVPRRPFITSAPRRRVSSTNPPALPRKTASPRTRPASPRTAAGKLAQPPPRHIPPCHRGAGPRGLTSCPASHNHAAFAPSVGLVVSLLPMPASHDSPAGFGSAVDAAAADWYSERHETPAGPPSNPSRRSSKHELLVPVAAAAVANMAMQVRTPRRSSGPAATPSRPPVTRVMSLPLPLPPLPLPPLLLRRSGATSRPGRQLCRASRLSSRTSPSQPIRYPPALRASLPSARSSGTPIATRAALSRAPPMTLPL